MIVFKIDELIPCLKKVDTGEIFDTEVVQIKRKSFLSKFNSKTGWYVNWNQFPEGTDVYALVLKGSMDIQGMVAIASDLSVKHGYDGYVYAEAMDEELYNYYCDKFGAAYLPSVNNPYRFMLSDETTQKLREVYNYEWTDEII